MNLENQKPDIKISSFEEIRSSFLPSTDQAGQDSLKIN